MDQKHDPAVAGGRLRALDGLRFLAAAAVVAFHYTGRDNPGWAESVREVFPTISRVTIYGGFGPYLFFMISGFVVLMSAWGRPVHSFIASRVGRLFPAYWVAVVLTAAVLLIDPRLIPVWDELGFSGVALNLTMLQSGFGVGHVDGVYWTLWIELKFYLLLALFAMVGITRRRLLLLCLAWPLAGAFAVQSGAGFLGGLLEPTYAPFFCLGILVYLVYREGWSGAVGLLLGLNYLLALRVCDAHVIGWTESVAGAPVSFRGLAVLLTLSLGALALVTLTRVSRCDWRWLTVLGALTYPLYLVHEYPGWVLIHHLAPHLPAYVTLVVTVAVAVAVAYAVYRLVEQPWGPHLRRAVERDLAGVVPVRAAVSNDDTAVLVDPLGTVGTTSRPVGPRVLPRSPMGAGVLPSRPGQTPVERHSRARSSAT